MTRNLGVMGNLPNDDSKSNESVENLAATLNFTGDMKFKAKEIFLVHEIGDGPLTLPSCVDDVLA